MYTIKRAASQVGISATTLRAWERRYRIVSPSRSEAGYRLYSDDDVRILSSMARLVADGWTPSLAAEEARQRSAALRQDAAVSQIAAVAQIGSAASTELQAAMLECAAELDSGRLTETLDRMFALGSYELVVDQHLLPAMVALGESWASGRVSVAGEHLVAYAVLRRLAAAYEAAALYSGSRRVLVGLPPGARHEIGALAFAVAARRRGIAIDYLGADLPVADWVGAVREPDTAAIVLAIPTPADLPATREVIAAVHAARPGLLVAVGGDQQESAPDAAVRLGHQVAMASNMLIKLLNPTAS